MNRSEWPRSRSVSPPWWVTKTSPCSNGFIVPGSTLMYGSSFCIVTRSPRVFSKRPSEEAVRPLPSDEATPPVTKMCLVTGSQAIAVRSAIRWMPASGSRRGQQFGGVLLCRGAVGRAREHPRDLDDPVTVGERNRSCGRGRAVVVLGHRDLRVGERRDLREVRDDQHLAVGGRATPAPGGGGGTPSPWRWAASSERT